MHELTSDCALYDSGLEKKHCHSNPSFNNMTKCACWVPCSVLIFEREWTSDWSDIPSTTKLYKYYRYYVLTVYHI